MALGLILDDCRHKPTGHDDAWITGFCWRRGATILRKEYCIKIVIGTLNAVWSIQKSIDPGASKRQVQRAIREIALRVCTARIRVELIGSEKDRLSIL